MTNRLMVSVAAIALIAGAGYANAQGAGGGHESGGAAMHNSAPAAGGAAGGGAAAGEPAGGAAMEKRDSAAPAQGGAEKQSQSEQKSPGAAKSQRADDNMPGQKSKGMSSENETKGGAKDTNKDMKAEGREAPNGNMKAEGRADSKNGNVNAETKNGNQNAEGKSNNERSQTTGMAGSGAKLNTEQRTKITSVIRNEHVTPITNVNFSISVGTRVPRDVEFRPLPTEVVTVYPEWRGYNFVMVRDQILVIDPETYEIVAVLDV
jgi:hypothetical protein